MESILSSKLLTTRRGTLILGIVAAVLAGIVLLVYLNHYRQTIAAENADVPVLVAKRVIEKGTPGNVIGSHEFFTPTNIPRRDLKDGAIADPAALRGRVALSDIYPGEQLTVANFSVTATTAIPTRLAREQRGIAIPVDAVHGITGALAAGDHVDVLVGLNVNCGSRINSVVKLLAQNILVLAAPGSAKSGLGSGSGKTVILRTNYKQAVRLAFAADNGRLWLIQRPIGNARPTPPVAANAEVELFGLNPVSVGKRSYLTKICRGR